MNNLTASGTITGIINNNASDYRIKTNVSNLSTESIDGLRPVKYFNKMVQKIDIGFIAHEVQEIIPELVSGQKDCIDGYQTLNYIGLIPILVKEIQDLKKRLSDAGL